MPIAKHSVCIKKYYLFSIKQFILQYLIEGNNVAHFIQHCSLFCSTLLMCSVSRVFLEYSEIYISGY